MVRTQIMLPGELYREAKRIADEREMSLAEVVRRGLEYIARLYPPTRDRESWELPKPMRLGRFQAPVEEWRELANAEPRPSSRSRR